MVFKKYWGHEFRLIQFSDYLFLFLFLHCSFNGSVIFSVKLIFHIAREDNFLIEQYESFYLTFSLISKQQPHFKYQHILNIIGLKVKVLKGGLRLRGHSWFLVNSSWQKTFSLPRGPLAAVLELSNMVFISRCSLPSYLWIVNVKMSLREL